MTMRGGCACAAMMFFNIRYQIALLLPGCASTVQGRSATALSAACSTRESSIESPMSTHCGWAFFSRRTGWSSKGLRGKGW